MTTQPTKQPGAFFQPGRTYTHGGDGFTAPELVTHFRVEHITRHPERGTLRAIGWMRNGSPDARWRGNFQDEGEFEGWTALAPESQPAPGLPVPEVGDRYTHCTKARTVTVTRVWTDGDGHTAVAYEWRDDKPGMAGSACPLGVFLGTYQPEADPQATTPAPVLSAVERQFLGFALDLAGDRMASDDGFTDEDEAALASLRKLAGGEQA